MNFHLIKPGSVGIHLEEVAIGLALGQFNVVGFHPSLYQFSLHGKWRAHLYLRRFKDIKLAMEIFYCNKKECDEKTRKKREKPYTEIRFNLESQWIFHG